jgi:FkbM family methyltransferase
MGPGDVLYDIGANVGAYSLVAASWTGGQATVYAFEPGYRTFPNLVENIFINGFEQTVIPFQIALGDRTAIVEFHYSRVDAGGARHIGIRRISGSTPVVRKQAVMTYRLDDLVPIFDLRPPTHVKIDVDGSELEVLRGARQVLASPCLQWILVEVDEAESNLQAVKALLEECGFCLEFDHYHVGSTVHNWIFRRKN